MSFFNVCNLKTQHGTGGESLAVAEINNESGSDDDDSVGDEVGGPITDGLSSEGSSDEHDGHDGKGDEITPAKTEYDGVSVSESDPEDAQSKIQRQRTLELGECASDSEDMRDSQVSSGWLGKAYNHASREAKEQATKQKAIEALAKVRALVKKQFRVINVLSSNQWGPLAK